MNPLLEVFIEKVLIPQIAIVFRAHQNAGLPPPTSEQVQAALGSDADAGIKLGEAWLAANPKSTEPPFPDLQPVIRP